MKGDEYMPQITLRAARVNVNMTLADVASKMGVAKQTISNWENGKSEPKISQMEELSKLYSLSSDFILMPIKSI